MRKASAVVQAADGVGEATSARVLLGVGAQVVMVAVMVEVPQGRVVEGGVAWALMVEVPQGRVVEGGGA